MSGYVIIHMQGRDVEDGPWKNQIYAFFKKSLRDGSKFFEDIDPESFYNTYTNYIDAILNRQHTRVSFAVLPDDFDNCLGWSIHEGKTLHYVFVKTGIAARNHGIATALVDKDFDRFTHLTKIGREIWKKKYPKAIFDPFTPEMK